MNDYPIILAHGIARFDSLTQDLAGKLHSHGINLGLAEGDLNYFKGIAHHLQHHGIDVHQSTVGFATDVEERAADLKREIEEALALRENSHPKVHIIAHSMGGLDARHMIVNHGMADRVASLTTIGTPHLGTSFADWGMANQGNHILEILRGVIVLDGFADLTTEACRAFNESAAAAEATNEVVYRTYSSSEEEKYVFTPLQLSWRIINDAEGENDGLVPSASQAWTDRLIGGGREKPVYQHKFPIAADHLNEVGWWDLNQIKRLSLFDLDFLRAIKKYEDGIKDVYLNIARDALAL